MRFAYYERLTKAGKAIYRKSDAVTGIELAAPEAFTSLATTIERALAADDPIAVERGAHELCAALAGALGVGPVSVRVLTVRPQLSRESELHGLYTRVPDKRPLIQVWMRTRAHERVVSFRTFVRTLFHELCHHLDYELLELPDSLHTEGFFRRESSLMRQILPRTVRSARRL